MNRRSFFGRVFGGVAAVVVAPFLPKRTLATAQLEARRNLQAAMGTFDLPLSEAQMSQLKAAHLNFFNPSPAYQLWMKKAMSEPIEIDPSKNVAFEWVDPA